MEETAVKINWQLIQDQLDYRTPMSITELHIQRNGNGYYACPRCRVTLEREYMSYCDRCGQCLNWTQYRKAKPIFL